MKRSDARELAFHFSYELAYTDEPADALLARRFEGEYYPTLAGEGGAFAEKPDKKQLEYITRVVRGVDEHGAELDGYIDKYSKGWDFSRISRTAAAIMRVAMFEVLYMDDVPDAAAINEAVEISKKYEEPDTVAFINGVLGSFVRGERN